MGAAGAEFRISHDPARAMAGHVEFRHHTDSPCPRIGHHLAQLILGCRTRLRTQLRSAGGHLVGPEVLIVAQMPVKHIELGRGHAIELVFDILGWELPKMTAHIQHEAPPAETRHVADGLARLQAGASLHGS